MRRLAAAAVVPLLLLGLVVVGAAAAAEAAAAVTAPVAAAEAEEGLAPGYWVEDEKGKCLDGSPPVYYHRPGTGDGAGKWLLYYEGGGWCSNTQECYDRSLTDLGSSLHYDEAKPLEWDMLSSDPGKNPLLHAWNVVFVKYCDGGFFSSDRMDTEVHRGKKLYYRGKYIQEAIFRDLVANRGMDKATEVIFGGCSAGAMAALVQVDYWAASDLFPPSVQRITAVPDSGFLLPYDGPERCRGYESRMINFYRFMSVQWAMPPGCLAQHTRDPWRCLFFLENSIPYVKTPLFVLQSRFDRWQREEHSLFCGKVDDAAANNRFGHAFEQRFYAVVGRNAKDGYLLDSCVRHCGSWGVVESDEGLTQEAAFRQWYRALPPTVRAAALDTPQSVGRAVARFFVQEGLLSPLLNANGTDIGEVVDDDIVGVVSTKDIAQAENTTTAAAADNDDDGAPPAAAKPAKKKPIFSILFPPKRHRRHRRHHHDDDAAATPPPSPSPTAAADADPHTPPSPFRFNNTGPYPCTACCRSGYSQHLQQQQQQARPQQQPEGPPPPAAPAAVGLHREMALLPWPRWPAEEGGSGAGGGHPNPIEGEARAAARGMVGDENGEGEVKEGMQEVEIDGMGNVLPVAARGQGARMLRLQRL